MIGVEIISSHLSCLFIVIKCTEHKIYHLNQFQVYISGTLNICTLFCTTIHPQNFVISPNWNSVPVSPFPLSQSQVTTLLSLSVNLTPLGTSYKWVHSTSYKWVHSICLFMPGLFHLVSCCIIQKLSIIQKTKIMGSSPIISWQIDGETVTRLYFLGLQNHCRW